MTGSGAAPAGLGARARTGAGERRQGSDGRGGAKVSPAPLHLHSGRTHQNPGWAKPDKLRATDGRALRGRLARTARSQPGGAAHGVRQPHSPRARGLRDPTGQWPKVAIARALYRDAPLLILDEPTAVLDPRSEHELLRRGGEYAEPWWLRAEKYGATA